MSRVITSDDLRRAAAVVDEAAARATIHAVELTVNQTFKRVDVTIRGMALYRPYTRKVSLED